MHDYTKLDVWKHSLRLAERLYRATDSLPADERFGLKSQMRRACVSVPSNIAERAARGTQKDFARFLRMASGSASELDTQVRIASAVGYFEERDATELLGAIRSTRNMLYSLQRAVQEDVHGPPGNT